LTGRRAWTGQRAPAEAEGVVVPVKLSGHPTRPRGASSGLCPLQDRYTCSQTEVSCRLRQDEVSEVSSTMGGVDSSGLLKTQQITRNPLSLFEWMNFKWGTQCCGESSLFKNSSGVVFRVSQIEQGSVARDLSRFPCAFSVFLTAVPSAWTRRLRMSLL